MTDADEPTEVHPENRAATEAVITKPRAVVTYRQRAGHHNEDDLSLESPAVAAYPRWTQQFNEDQAIVVWNLPLGASAMDLKQLGGSLGRLVHSELCLDSAGEPTEGALVFATPQRAEMARREATGATLANHSLDACLYTVSGRVWDKEVREVGGTTSSRFKDTRD